MDSGLLEKPQVEEIALHWPINISAQSSAQLYAARFVDYFPFFKRCLTHKDCKYKQLYELAQDRIAGEFDVIKLIKHLRELKVIAKNTFLNEKHKLLISH